jgi:hypothetical protein
LQRSTLENSLRAAAMLEEAVALCFGWISHFLSKNLHYVVFVEIRSERLNALILRGIRRLWKEEGLQEIGNG